MGQRLNIEVVDDDKVLANAYYHWSAYTSSALHLTTTLLEAITDTSYASYDHNDKVVYAVKILETTGAGMNDEEMEYASENIKDFDKHAFKGSIDRNIGLLSISPNGIAETEQWEEGRVTVNLTSRTINFNVVYFQSKEDFIAESQEDLGEVPELPPYEFDSQNIPFDAFPDIANSLLDMITKGHYSILVDKDTVCCFIE